jgi:predicted amidophosphoribosyltransferase
MTTGPGPAAPAVCPNCRRPVSAAGNFCEACRTDLAPAVVSGDAPATATECAFCHAGQITADG